jgi:hypothetical protein
MAPSLRQRHNGNASADPNSITIDVEAGNGHGHGAPRPRTASTVSGRRLSKGRTEDLGEYAALERYISTYREVSSAADDDDNDKKRRKRWWQFWRGSTEPTHLAKDKKPSAPDAWLETDIHGGLSSAEVAERRKSSGWNELTAESENMFVKFLSYFTGPILYGMLDPFPPTGSPPSSWGTQVWKTS